MWKLLRQGQEGGVIDGGLELWIGRQETWLGGCGVAPSKLLDFG